LAVRTDRDTGQLILSGQSEEHLDRTLAELTENERLPVNVGRPQVAYRETITRPIEYTYTHKRQTCRAGQYAAVKIIFTPREWGQGFKFIDSIGGGAILREFIPSVEKGLMVQKEDGVLAGYPTVDFSAELIDGKYHDVDSNALTFEIAARACFRTALPLAGPIILEPVMKVEVVTPEDSLGAVIDGVNRRRRQIVSQLERDSEIAIEALVPLAEMFGYIGDLHRISQFRASFSMQYHHYAVVPRFELPPDNFPPAIGLRA
jgi:elongation factor G